MQTRRLRAELTRALAVVGALSVLTFAADARAAEPPAENEFEALAGRGLRAFEAERYAEALASFDAALRRGDAEPDAAVVAFNAAACVFALGRYAEAESRFLEVARRWPEKQAIARLNAGYAALFDRRLAAAERHLAASRGDASLASQRADLEQRLDKARRSAALTASNSGGRGTAAKKLEPERARSRLPPEGPSAWLLASVGYDDNAEQSGTNDALDGATGDQIGSAFAAFQAELDTTARVSERLALTPYYSGDWMGLFDSAVSDLSIQSHELGLRTSLSASPSLGFRLTAAAAHVISGLDTLDPLLWELSFGARADLRSGSRFRTRIELVSRPSFGVGDHQFLDGVRTDAFVGERARFGIVELGIDLRLRWLDIGEQRLELSPSSFAVCAPNCGQYRIPLSYVAPGAGLDASLEPLEWLELSSGVRVEQRRYLEPNAISGFPETRKRRRDLRFRVRAGVAAELDRDARYVLGLDYTRLQNDSNVALDAGDLENDTDYADRNFVQNVVELGVQATF